MSTPAAFFHVRIAVPSEPQDGWVGRMPNNMPVWLWNPTMPLLRDDAERLRDDAVRLLGGTYRLEPTEPFCPDHHQRLMEFRAQDPDEIVYGHGARLDHLPVADARH